MKIAHEEQQNGEVYLTGFEASGYPNRSPMGMFELIDKEKRRGWRKFIPIQRAGRRKGPLPPRPPAKNKKKEDEEKEQQRLAQQAQQIAEQIQHGVEAASLKSDVRPQSATKRALHQLDSNEGVQLRQVTLPDLSAAIPAVEAVAPGAAAIVKLYEQERANGIPQPADRLTQFYNDIIENTPDAEKPTIETLVLQHLRNAIVESKRHEPVEEQQRRQEKQEADLDEMSEGYERYQGRTGYLNEIYAADGQRAKRSDIIADRKLRDYAFDRIFALVDAQPDQQFQTAFDIFTDQVKYRGIISDLLDASQDPRYITPHAIERYKGIHGHSVDGLSDLEIIQKIQEEVKSDLERYKLERRVRETVHNANFVLDVANIKAEQIYDFVDGFSSELIDYVWRMPGVRDMMNIYEMQLRQAMYEKDGYLDPEDVKRYVRTEVEGDSRRQAVITPVIEERTKKLFREQYANKDRREDRGVYVRSDRRDKTEHVLDHKLEDWEIDRIFTSARGMMVLSLRMLSLAAESKIPANGQYTSLYMQDAIQSYAPFQHLLWKYHVPSDKALAMLLIEPDRDKIFGKIRKPWMTKHIEQVKHVLEDGGPGARQIMDGEMGEFLQLRRQNPGLCGDIFGFLGWRVGQDPDSITGAELFLNVGRERMQMRVGEQTGPLAMSHDALDVFNGLDEEGKKAYIKEYGNWIGTGFRFERQRGGLISQKEDERIAAQEASKKLLARIVEIQPGRIFLKSSKIQNRLKDSLDEIATRRGYDRERRVDDVYYSSPRDVMMKKVQENLLFLESHMYKMREELLSEGYTFDGEIGKKFMLTDIKARLDRDGIDLPHHLDPQAWDATREFIDLMQHDFQTHTDTRGEWIMEHGHKKYTTNEEGYYREFIEAREYNHGFTLWSGDAPVDEFNMAATGPTGGFIRRARENKDVGEANGLITNFLSDLKYIRTPDEAFGHLTKIYSKIQSYDASMAKETITYLAEGVMKFYGATGLAKAPVLGPLIQIYPDFFRSLATLPGKLPFIGGENGLVDRTVKKLYNLPGIGGYIQDGSLYITGSLAQRFFGKRAPVWHGGEMKYFVHNLLADHGYITPQQKKTLSDRLSAHGYDAMLDFGGTMAPLLAIAILFWLIKESAEEV